MKYKKLAIFLPMIALTLTMVGCQSLQRSGLSERDVEAIRKASRLWVVTALAKDWDAFIELYTEDAVYMPQGGNTRVGHAAIRADFGEFPIGTDLTLTPWDIDGCGDVAFVRGSFKFSMPRKKADPINVTGKYLEVWKKQRDGSWRIFRDIWNTDQPLP